MSSARYFHEDDAEDIEALSVALIAEKAAHPPHTGGYEASRLHCATCDFICELTEVLAEATPNQPPTRSPDTDR